MTRTNGHESVQIDIFKEADANIVAGGAGTFQPARAMLSTSTSRRSL